MKDLPAGIRTFSEFIKSDTLYVDKTEYLYNLIKRSGRYFLSRPRRFGKSLTCSTLETIFSGDKELFKDLWIGKSDYDWQVRPVIYFDFSGISNKTSEVLIKDLHKSIDFYAKKYGIILEEESLKRKFAELIRTLGQTRNSVVIIIDEYDQPITSHINNPEQAELLRVELEDFYVTLKTDDIDKNLYFLFVTGVAKFSKMSLFSHLNQLIDLTNSTLASALVGYTDGEVDLYLKEHIQEFADKRNESYEISRAALKTWYNGYRFSSENITVYNPVSLHNCLREKRLDNFWLSTGTSGFLIKFIEKNPSIANQIESIDGSFCTTSDLESLTPSLYYQNYVTVLIQTGYLTFISGYDENKRGYKVGYPNEEVRYSLTEQIMNCIGGITSSQFSEFGDRFRSALKDDNIELFCKHLQDFLRLIPHNIRVNREKFYNQVFFMVCVLFGKRPTTEVTTELATDKGFIDLLLEGTKNTFVVEFKINKKPEVALKQIEKNDTGSALKS